VIYKAVDSPRQYTFAEVKAEATAFGAGLRHLWDWHKGEVLALFSPNDVDYAPIIYGTFFAGGTVTPANPTYSVDELAFQLSNSDAKAIVTTRQFLETALKAVDKAKIDQDRVILLGAQKDDTHDFRHWTNISKASGCIAVLSSSSCQHSTWTCFWKRSRSTESPLPMLRRPSLFALRGMS
jgi:4-coumarate--CoA ligase